MNVGHVDADGFEGLDDFGCSAARRDVHAAHLKHLHEGDHRARRHGKGVGCAHTNLHRAVEGHLSELLCDALVEFKHRHCPHLDVLSADAPHFSIGINITPNGVNSIACFARL